MEYEIRILEVDVNSWIKYLESNGATLIGDWHQKRKVYDFKPVNPNKWLRLRTTGEETTLTIKETLDETRIDGTRELEISVSDFDVASDILEELGYKERNFQENKRIRYMYQGVEFDFDTWPLIPTYVEIEGKSLEDVERVLKELPFDVSKKTTLDVETIYNKVYNIPLRDYKIFTFESQIK